MAEEYDPASPTDDGYVAPVRQTFLSTCDIPLPIAQQRITIPLSSRKSEHNSAKHLSRMSGQQKPTKSAESVRTNEEFSNIPLPGDIAFRETQKGGYHTSSNVSPVPPPPKMPLKSIRSSLISSKSPLVSTKHPLVSTKSLVLPSTSHTEHTRTQLAASDTPKHVDTQPSQPTMSEAKAMIIQKLANSSNISPFGNRVRPKFMAARMPIKDRLAERKISFSIKTTKRLAGSGVPETDAPDSGSDEPTEEKSSDKPRLNSPNSTFLAIEKMAQSKLQLQKQNTQKFTPQKNTRQNLGKTIVLSEYSTKSTTKTSPQTKVTQDDTVPQLTLYSTEDLSMKTEVTSSNDSSLLDQHLHTKQQLDTSKENPSHFSDQKELNITKNKTEVIDGQGDTKIKADDSPGNNVSTNEKYVPKDKNSSNRRRSKSKDHSPEQSKDQRKYRNKHYQDKPPYRSRNYSPDRSSQHSPDRSRRRMRSTSHERNQTRLKMDRKRSDSRDKSLSSNRSISPSRSPSKQKASTIKVLTDDLKETTSKQDAITSAVDTKFPTKISRTKSPLEEITIPHETMDTSIIKSTFRDSHSLEVDASGLTKRLGTLANQQDAAHNRSPSKESVKSQSKEAIYQEKRSISPLKLSKDELLHEKHKNSASEVGKKSKQGTSVLSSKQRSSSPEQIKQKSKEKSSKYRSRSSSADDTRKHTKKSVSRDNSKENILKGHTEKDTKEQLRRKTSKKNKSRSSSEESVKTSQVPKRRHRDTKPESRSRSSSKDNVKRKESTEKFSKKQRSRSSSPDMRSQKSKKTKDVERQSRSRSPSEDIVKRKKKKTKKERGRSASIEKEKVHSKKKKKARSRSSSSSSDDSRERKQSKIRKKKKQKSRSSSEETNSKKSSRESLPLKKGKNNRSRSSSTGKASKRHGKAKVQSRSPSIEKITRKYSKEHVKERSRSTSEVKGSKTVSKERHVRERSLSLSDDEGKEKRKRHIKKVVSRSPSKDDSKKQLKEKTVSKETSRSSSKETIKRKHSSESLKKERLASSEDEKIQAKSRSNSADVRRKYSNERTSRKDGWSSSDDEPYKKDKKDTKKANDGSTSKEVEKSKVRQEILPKKESWSSSEDDEEALVHDNKKLSRSSSKEELKHMKEHISKKDSSSTENRRIERKYPKDTSENQRDASLAGGRTVSSHGDNSTDRNALITEEKFIKDANPARSSRSVSPKREIDKAISIEKDTDEKALIENQSTVKTPVDSKSLFEMYKAKFMKHKGLTGGMATAGKENNVIKDKTKDDLSPDMFGPKLPTTAVVEKPNSDMYGPKLPVKMESKSVKSEILDMFGPKLPMQIEARTVSLDEYGPKVFPKEIKHENKLKTNEKDSDEYYGPKLPAFVSKPDPKPLKVDSLDTFGPNLLDAVPVNVENVTVSNQEFIEKVDKEEAKDDVDATKNEKEGDSNELESEYNDFMQMCELSELEPKKTKLVDVSKVGKDTILKSITATIAELSKEVERKKGKTPVLGVPPVTSTANAELTSKIEELKNSFVENNSTHDKQSPFVENNSTHDKQSPANDIDKGIEKNVKASDLQTGFGLVGDYGDSESDSEETIDVKPCDDIRVVKPQDDGKMKPTVDVERTESTSSDLPILQDNSNAQQGNSVDILSNQTGQDIKQKSVEVPTFHVETEVVINNGNSEVNATKEIPVITPQIIAESIQDILSTITKPKNSVDRKSPPISALQAVPKDNTVLTTVAPQEEKTLVTQFHSESTVATIGKISPETLPCSTPTQAVPKAAPVAFTQLTVADQQLSSFAQEYARQRLSTDLINTDSADSQTVDMDIDTSSVSERVAFNDNISVTANLNMDSVVAVDMDIATPERESDSVDKIVSVDMDIDTPEKGQTHGSNMGPLASLSVRKDLFGDNKDSQVNLNAVEPVKTLVELPVLVARPSVQSFSKIDEGVRKIQDAISKKEKNRVESGVKERGRKKIDIFGTTDDMFFNLDSIPLPSARGSSKNVSPVKMPDHVSSIPLPDSIVVDKVSIPETEAKPNKSVDKIALTTPKSTESPTFVFESPGLTPRVLEINKFSMSIKKNAVSPKVAKELEEEEPISSGFGTFNFKNYTKKPIPPEPKPEVVEEKVNENSGKIDQVVMTDEKIVGPPKKPIIRDHRIPPNIRGRKFEEEKPQKPLEIFEDQQNECENKATPGRSPRRQTGSNTESNIPCEDSGSSCQSASPKVEQLVRDQITVSSSASSSEELLVVTDSLHSCQTISSESLVVTDSSDAYKTVSSESLSNYTSTEQETKFTAIITPDVPKKEENILDMYTSPAKRRLAESSRSSERRSVDRNRSPNRRRSPDRRRSRRSEERGTRRSTSPSKSQDRSKSPYRRRYRSPDRSRVSSRYRSPDRQRSPVRRKSPYRSPNRRISPFVRSPLRKSPLRKSPLRVSPLRKSPLRKSPLRKSPLRKSPLRKSPLRKSPLRNISSDRTLDRYTSISSSRLAKGNRSRESLSPKRRSLTPARYRSPDKHLSLERLRSPGKRSSLERYRSPDSHHSKEPYRSPDRSLKDGYATPPSYPQNPPLPPEADTPPLPPATYSIPTAPTFTPEKRAIPDLDARIDQMLHEDDPAPPPPVPQPTYPYPSQPGYPQSSLAYPQNMGVQQDPNYQQNFGTMKSTPEMFYQQINSAGHNDPSLMYQHLQDPQNMQLLAQQQLMQQQMAQQQMAQQQMGQQQMGQQVMGQQVMGQHLMGAQQMNEMMNQQGMDNSIPGQFQSFNPYSQQFGPNTQVSNYDSQNFPPQTFGQPNFESQNYSSENYDSQTFGSQDYDSHNFGPSGYDSQDFGSHNYDQQNFDQQQFDPNYNQQDFNQQDYGSENFDESQEQFGTYGRGEFIENQQLISPRNNDMPPHFGRNNWSKNNVEIPVNQNMKNKNLPCTKKKVPEVFKSLANKNIAKIDSPNDKTTVVKVVPAKKTKEKCDSQSGPSGKHKEPVDITPQPSPTDSGSPLLSEQSNVVTSQSLPEESQVVELSTDEKPVDDKDIVNTDKISPKLEDSQVTSETDTQNSEQDTASEVDYKQSEDDEDNFAPRRRSSRIRSQEERKGSVGEKSSVKEKKKAKKDEVCEEAKKAPEDKKTAVVLKPPKTETTPNNENEPVLVNDGMHSVTTMENVPTKFLRPMLEQPDKKDEVTPGKLKSRWLRTSEAEAESTMSPRSDTLTEESDTESLSSSSSRSLPKNLLPPNKRGLAFMDMDDTDQDKSRQQVVTSSDADQKVSFPTRLVTVAAKKDVEVMKMEPTSSTNDDSSTVALNDLTNKQSTPKEVPPFYETITENIFLKERHRSKQMKEVKRMVCDCTTSSEDRSQGLDPCGDDCLNRMLMIECGSRCPCGDHCTNKRFFRKEYLKVEAFKTDSKGWGLKACVDLPAEGLIMEYVGEVLDYREFKARTKLYARENRHHHYFMALNGDEVIDATLKGNISRFMNHSCDPNSETQKWTVNGDLRVGFFTRRPVSANEELTFDYQFENYGKEAQKCYCGASNCRGILGGKTTPLKQQRRSSTEKKTKDLFEDDTLSEDIDALSQLDGLRNRMDVLNICRLMVRAELRQHRAVIVNTLERTSEMNCLRLFLGYHGLRLLWSWMTDIVSVDLKLEILRLLAKLPITNKSTLTESKVLTIVERWATETSHDRTGTPRDHEATTSQDESSGTESLQSAIKNPTATVASVDEKPPKKRRVKFTDETSSDSDISNPDRVNNLDKGGENGSGDATESRLENVIDPDELDEQMEKAREVITMATQQLQQWEYLNEYFKIPKKRVEERKQTERDLVSTRNTEIIIPNAEVTVNQTKRKTEEPECKNSRNKRTKKEEETKKPKLTKEEHRQLFEAQIRAKDEMDEIKRQEAALQQENETQPIPVDPRDPPFLYDPTYPQINPNFPQNQNVPPHFQSPNFPSNFTPNPAFMQEQNFAPPNSQNFTPEFALPGFTPEASFGMNPQFAGDMYGTVPQTAMSIIQQNPPRQHPGMGLTPGLDPSLEQQYMEGNITPLIDATPQQGAVFPPGIPNFQMQSAVYSASPVTPTQPSPITPQPFPPPSILFPTPPVQRAYKAPHAQPSPLSSVSKIPAQVETPQSPPEEVPPPPSPPKAKPSKLPPNWKTARDSEGQLYYYHTITRQTQWDLPAWESKEPHDMELESPIGDDVISIEKPSSSKTTTAAADTSSESARKSKEQFRHKISGFIVTCLSTYRKQDCKQGRIRSTDDFKHLARKLTHHIMAKELKHCRHIEDLEANENVKAKARDYVRKYMSRFGKLYKSNSPEPVIDIYDD